ncbi:aldehyde dehydrogenase family protein [Halodurantibacterium flavum]|uniref:Aldehyde dehydrogenase family protein n=1 Tax=Halodurantibacterium flavum TaxID=1382802 RepID=A0ABW4S0H7_9RHOB
MNIAQTDGFTANTRNWLSGGARKLLIGGEWVEAATGETFATFNPSTGRELAQIARGDARDVDRATRAARAAFEGEWSRVKPYDRQMMMLRLADLVERHIDELGELDTLEMGAPIARIPFMRRRSPSMLRYYAGLTTNLHGDTVQNSLPGQIFSYTTREPIGVVGAIIPWNVPLGAALIKLAPVLATGCTLVLKPAEEASLSSLRLGELVREAGVPAGVVNIITGYGAEAGAAIAEHPDIDKVAFTGSTLTGRRIVEASKGNLKRLSLELGGKSPDIIFADAPMDAAIPGAAMAVFGNTGQVCSAGTRLFIERKVFDEVIEKILAFTASLRVGLATDPETQIGPIASERQMNRVLEYLAVGQTEGARLRAGGMRATTTGLENGYFVTPTVFSDVRDDMRIVQEEIFGPVVAAIPFDDPEEVVRRANASIFGLGAGIWTTNLGRAHRMAAALRSGSVWVNSYQLMDPAMPFGGFKQSGYGRESGAEHLDEFMTTKAVWINTEC